MEPWSVVNFASLFAGLDLAAEHYHPDKLKRLAHLSRGGRPVASYVRSVREMVNPAPDDAAPVFDLRAAYNHVLQYADAESEDRVSTKKVCRAGDVIISRLRSYLQQVAIVPPEVKRAYLSTEFIVLRAQDGLHADFLLPFFLSETVQTILAWSQDGNEHPRFNESVLLGLSIPPAVESLSEKLSNLVAQTASSCTKGCTAFADAEALLVSALELDKLDLTPRLFYETNCAKAAQAGRLDAEHACVPDLLSMWNPAYPVQPLGNGAVAVRVANGATPAASEYGPEGIPIVKVADITNHGSAEFGGEYVTPGTKTLSTIKGQIQPGEVLVLAAAHHVRYIGKAGLLEAWPDKQKKCQCVGELIAIRPGRAIAGEVLTCYLNTKPIRMQIQRLARGMSAHLYPDDLKTLPVPIIDMEIQRQIIAKVRESFAARQEARRLLGKAKRMVEEAILGARPVERKGGSGALIG